ncbi:hypothetical protein N658DRAFT_497773 [Parathielavia hyrcaniae]|uniref:RING-type domain-containing protein n=1 Tax=Parathielavia hyrcaniae TaxID=113614 RepID=A0AAN6Q1M2_9PEZI|nr:hypothetical protein N658DRAFT_497773 [Parathielavia hyrcaniae]
MSATSSAPSKAPPIPAAANHSPSGPATSNTSFDANRRPSHSPLHSQAAPRKSQGSKKQHRSQRRAETPAEMRHLDDEDALAEIRALRNASSRRGQTSITHLMSYALPPRPHESHHTSNYSRSYRRNPSWGVGSGYHAADKARYIHANYRFVVAPNGNYAAQAADADRYLDWGDVVQVIASAESQQASCPICLSDPVSPRMAKCGHIFCLPCLMRFMNISNSEEPGKKQNRWRKCPICEDAIYLSDVRPVRFYAGQECPLPRKGDDVILRLMMRSGRSTLALPKEGAADVLESGEDIPWHFAANVLDYARIMRGTSDYMVEQFDREIEDLLTQEKEDELLYHEDSEWTQKAIRAIRTAKEKLAEPGETEPAPPLTTTTPGPGPTKQVEQDFYFYTSPPHLYLSPLDIRILKTKYGSFSAFPSTLLPRVEHITTGHAVDEALRKRAKYLSHLPRGCLISFLECDWTDIVPPDILAAFSDEIERRRKRNREKATQEERERLQAERQEAAALRDARRNYGGGGGGGGNDAVTVRFGSSSGAVVYDEPPVDMSDFLPLGAEGTTPPNPRPGFSPLADMSTSPTGRRTVWGTPLVGGPAEEVPTAPRPHHQVDDGWLKDTDVLETLGAADIAVQLEALGVESDGGATTSSAAAAAGAVAVAGASTAGGGGGNGAKKKKKQKITLMSTGGRRGL